MNVAPSDSSRWQLYESAPQSYETARKRQERLCHGTTGMSRSINDSASWAVVFYREAALLALAPLAPRPPEARIGRCCDYMHKRPSKTTVLSITYDQFPQARTAGNGFEPLSVTIPTTPI